MPTSPRAEPRLPALLVRNSNFVLLWAAYGVSAFGDHLSEAALFKTVGGMDRPDSVRVKALMTFCFFLPFAVLGPLAGWWADRFTRKWTMIAADLVRLVIMFTLTWTVPWLLGRGLGDFAVSLPLVAAGLFAAFFSPARQAMVPTLIRDDQLVRANALISALGTIAAILSAWVGGILVDLSIAGKLHADWNYRLDALTFLVSALLISAIRLARSRAVPHQLAAGLWQPLREGFQYVARHRRVLQVILLATVFWAGAGIVDAVLPAIVRHVFHGSYANAGAFKGLIAAGLAVGAAVLTVLGQAAPLPLIILTSMLGGALWLAVLDLTYVLRIGQWLAATSLFLVGVHGAGILVSTMVVVQRFVPDARRGRVFGVADMCTMSAIVLATGVLGLPDIPHLDDYVPWLLGFTALLLGTAGVLAWRTYRRGDPHSPLVWLLWRVLRLYTAFWCRVERQGPCSVPRRGPVILAANHTSGIDPLLILGTCTHRLTAFLVEREYYHGLTGALVRLAGCVPVDRARPTASSVRAALRVLDAGGCLGVFPQGGFVAPGEPEPDARPGVGYLALRSGAVIVPCHISGTRYTDRPLGALWRRHRARIRFGRPIDVSAWAAQPNRKAAARALSEHVLREVQALGAERAP
jgi:1-acyl-sn-glycerol-3-phosphate acyltransferase